MKRVFLLLLINYLLFVSFVLPALAAPVICSGTADCHVYVDLSAANLADCGIENGTDDNNAFCSLAAAEAAYDADISGWSPGANMYFHLKGGDSADGPVRFWGWNTDADNRIIVQVDLEDQNTGNTYSTSHYRIEVNAVADKARGIEIAENYVEIYGVQIKVTSNDYDDATGVYANNIVGSGEIVLGYLRVVGNLGANLDKEGWGIAILDTDYSAIIYNSIVYDFDLPGSRGLYLGAFDSIDLYNVVVGNSAVGFYESDSPINCYNCAAYNNTDNWFGKNWAGTNNATGPDTTGCPATTGSCLTLSTDNSDFTDPDAGDYTITNENSVLYDAGKDLDADLGVGWHDDLVGTDRTTDAAWDVGAYEFIHVECTDDIDNDGVCDDVDNCLAVANASQSDADTDGVGDACDVCPLIGDDQSDSDSDSIGDACDVCPLIADDQSDSDSDGIGDACDTCPTDPGKLEPGICGCGTSDIDTDGDNTPDCNDQCPADPNKTEPGICGCGTSDDDNDGICDDVDNCSGVVNPDQFDSDSDGVGDVCDTCPADPGKSEPGVCGCGTSDIDTDGDNTPDCNDQCPADPNKTEPGICGCGSSDNDGDGICDDADNCPDVVNPDQSDSDFDGVGDACDTCPADPGKSEPGVCGCGTSDIDSDGDNIPDCNDQCPADPNKIEPGVNGCGELEDETIYTYDFQWYSGASQPWVYEAAAMLHLDVYEDLSTPENDVFFRFRNDIYTPLGYLSRIFQVQVDTGITAPNMFSSLGIWDSSPEVYFYDQTPGEPVNLIDIASPRINWTGDYAVGNIDVSVPKTDGVNPGEYATIRAVLNNGFQFADVINAINIGLTTTYVDGPYSEWTQSEKDAYRAGAPSGLRFAMLVHSIVPNEWDQDGHGLFVTGSLVSDGTSPQITSLTAEPSSILDTESSQMTVTANDPDNGPDPLSYQWNILVGGGSLDDPFSPTPIYTPEDVTGTRTVTLRVVVSDGETNVSEEISLQVTDADPPPATELFAEDFSDNLLSGWSVWDDGIYTAPSNWIVEAGELVQKSNIWGGSSRAEVLPKPGTFLLYDSGMGWLDYRASFVMRSEDDDALGFIFRYQDHDNYYRFSWDMQRGYRRLVKNEDGVFTELAVDYVPYVEGQNYQVEIVAYGTQLEVWIDGIQIFQATDSAHLQGSVAFYTWMLSGAYFDDLMVEDLSGGAMNASPQITGLTADQASILDTETSQLSVVADDPDNSPDPLSYQWNILVGGGFLDDPFSPTPIYTPEDVTGTRTVTLRVDVSDGAVTVSEEISLQVTDADAPPSNELPQITGLTAEPSSILDTETSQLTVVAEDPDNGPNPLSYQWYILTGGGFLDDPGSSTPTYIPDDVTGTQTVMLRVEVNDGEATVSGDLSLQVTDADAPPVNVFPQITGLTAEPSSILDTETSLLTVVANDPDSGPAPLSYHWNVLSGGGYLDDPNSSTPTYIPDDVTGSQTVTLRVEVSDGEVTVSEEISLQVADADAPPVMELLTEDFSDSFLSGWSVWDDGIYTAPSDWDIEAGELVQRSNIWGGSGVATVLPKPGTYLLYDSGMGWLDYRVIFMMRAEDNDALGMMFRYQDSDNYYRFSWDKQRSYRRLVKNEGGVFTELAVDYVPYVQGQNYQVEIVAYGTQLEVWIDGIQIFQVDDSAHPQGSVAFYSWNSMGAYFDDLVVEDLSGSAGNALPQITGLTAEPSSILDTETSQLTVVAEDPDNGPNPLSYQWYILTGGGFLDDPGSSTPTYIPDDVTGTQTVMLRVEVNDGEATVSGDLSLQVTDADAPPAVELFSDDFSDISLSGWSVWDDGIYTGPSDWDIEAGELVQRSNIWGGSQIATVLPKPGTYLLYDNGMEWLDYRTSFMMRAQDDDALGIMFRYRDADNYYLFSWDRQRSYRRLVKNEGGVFTDLAVDHVPYLQGQNYQVKIIAFGPQLEVWIDGNLIFQVTNSAHQQGSIAFYTWNMAGAYFDNLVVEDLSGGYF